MHFPTVLQETVFTNTYARYDYDKGRRETWHETVTRATQFLRELSKNQLPSSVYKELFDGIYNLEVMPSMRLLSMAGEAARRSNISIFNCSALALDSIDALVEVMMLSMNGCGVGYSVENIHVDEFPTLLPATGKTRYHLIGDSTEGWCDALRDGLDAWVSGDDIEFNFLLVRPAGTPLRVKGGRASGPEPLKKSLSKIREIIFKRREEGNYLRSIDLHDIACWIADASISGGVRRSALISLFDANDRNMLEAKAGAFWNENPQRSLANNSAVLTDAIDDWEVNALLQRMNASGTGEPGLFNRDGARRNIPRRRNPNYEFLTNPCAEILLRNMQTCNLSSVVCRADDTVHSLFRKVRLASVIGTIQSMADDFHNLRPQWRQNQIEERLLGVDLNGQMDSALAREVGVQSTLKELAIIENEITATVLGINPAAAVTTTKPSGNSSQLVNASSGVHARWSPYYIRRLRFNHTSPVLKALHSIGVPSTPENGQTDENAVTRVVEFPVKSPDGAIVNGQRSALEQLEYVKQLKRCYTEHTPSVTITYTPDEFAAITEWVEENREYVVGLSFLPKNDHTYPQAPYEEITREEYERRAAIFPKSVDFTALMDEREDYTTSSSEIACVAGACETI